MNADEILFAKVVQALPGIFEDEQGQYIIAADGDRVYGVWIVSEDGGRPLSSGRESVP